MAVSQRQVAAVVLSTVWTVSRLKRSAEFRLDGANRYGLTWRQFEALESVASSSQSTHGELAKSLDVTAAVVTGLVDRLEKRGYLRRFDDGTDRRVVYLAVTESGRRKLFEVQSELRDSIAHAISRLGAEDIQALERSLDLLTDPKPTACRHCRNPTHPGDRFCSVCGTTLSH